MPTTGRNIDALDGLRGCAVLLVVLLHVLQYQVGRAAFLRGTIGGWSVLGSGVELFFVLSGFLLFLPYARAAFLDRDPPSVQKFFQRRAFRILPAYWASLAIFVLVLLPLHDAPLGVPSSSGITNVGLHVILAQNLLKSYFEGINPVYWTMAVEVQFYIVLPIIASVVVSKIRRGRSSAAIAVFAGIGICSILAYAVSLSLHRLGGGFERFVQVPAMVQYLPVFGVGMVASLAYVAATDGPWVGRDLRAKGKAVGLGGLLLLGLLVGLNQAELYHWRYGYIITDQMAGLAYGAILLGVVLGWRSWQRGLKSGWLRFFGMISYSLYIWNLVAIQRFVLPQVDRYVHGGVAIVLLGLVASLVVLVPISLVSYLAFERPFIAARRSHHE